MKKFKVEMYFDNVFSPEITQDGTKKEVLKWVEHMMEFHRDLYTACDLVFNAELHKNGVMTICGKFPGFRIAKIMFVIMEIR